MHRKLYQRETIALLVVFALAALLSCEQCQHQLTAMLGAPANEQTHRATPLTSSSLRGQQSEQSNELEKDSTLVEPIQQITLLGERNSGTSWTFE